VADTGNGRIEKFSQDGSFVARIKGFEAPSGIAIDRAGNIYVAEIGSKHRVQKLGPDGRSVAAWAPGLYGPRKIAIGADESNARPRPIDRFQTSANFRTVSGLCRILFHSELSTSKWEA